LKVTQRRRRLGLTFDNTDTVQLSTGESAITLLFNYNKGILVTLKKKKKNKLVSPTEDNK